MKLIKFVMPLLFMVLVCPAMAQRVALKTNLPMDATASVNVGMELGLSDKWTLDVSGNLRFWNVSDRSTFKYWMVQPEARYWLCDKFIGSFLGFHLHGGQYNLGNLDNGIKFLGTDFSKLSDSRYQGWFAGLGIGYGYSWVLNKHWNLEAEAGLGYSHTRYEQYPCAHCGEVEEEGKHHYVGVTKAALNLIYLF